MAYGDENILCGRHPNKFIVENILTFYQNNPKNKINKKKKSIMHCVVGRRLFKITSVKCFQINFSKSNWKKKSQT